MKPNLCNKKNPGGAQWSLLTKLEPSVARVYFLQDSFVGRSQINNIVIGHAKRRSLLGFIGSFDGTITKVQIFHIPGRTGDILLKVTERFTGLTEVKVAHNKAGSIRWILCSLCTVSPVTRPSDFPVTAGSLSSHSGSPKLSISRSD